MRMTTDLGELIRKLRNVRGISRSELAEWAEISLSHLEKIETGQRTPGMNTFVKIMLVLDINISLCSTDNIVQEQCITVVEDIFLTCSEGEARYLTHMVECMAESFTLIV